MTNRVTMKQLDQLAGIINRQLGVEATEAWTRQEDGTYKANIGYYYVTSHGCGVAFVRLCNSGGGLVDILTGGTKRELIGKMRAFSSGLAAREGLE